MTAGQKVIILVLAFIGSVAVAFEEPSYEGKPLTSWIEDLNDPALGLHAGPPPSVMAKAEAAAHAIRQIGTNAVPFLLQQFESQNETNRNQARAGFALLGAAGAGAIPQLSKWLDDPARRGEAITCLYQIGPNATPAMYMVLTNRNPQISMGAVDFFLEYGRNDPKLLEALVDALVNAIDSQQEGVRGTASFALGRIRGDTGKVVPALAKCVADADPGTRRNAVVALSYYGTSVGSQGITAVTEATKDPVQYIRREALAALPKIAGEDVVVAALIAGLKDDAAVVQVEAANQIGWLVFPKGAEITMPTRPERTYADKCVPALVVGLSHKDWTVRAACAAALGEFRAQAQSAIPILEVTLRDEAMQVRWAADSALKKIRKSLPAK